MFLLKNWDYSVDRHRLWTENRSEMTSVRSKPLFEAGVCLGGIKLSSCDVCLFIAFFWLNHSVLVWSLVNGLLQSCISHTEMWGKTSFKTFLQFLTGLGNNLGNSDPCLWYLEASWSWDGSARCEPQCQVCTSGAGSDAGLPVTVSRWKRAFQINLGAGKWQFYEKTYFFRPHPRMGYSGHPPWSTTFLTCIPKCIFF